MSDDDRSQKLVTLGLHKRRLHLLQHQAAINGTRVDPAVPIEIETITDQIRALEQDLDRDLPRLLQTAQGRREELARIVEDMLSYAREVLNDNQSILTEFFVDQTQRPIVYKQMVRLYHHQRNHGYYGRWRAILAQLAELEANEPLQPYIAEAQRLVQRLETLLYNRDILPESVTKRAIMQMLGPMSAVEEKELSVTTEQYLDELRTTVDEIGALSGRVRVMP